MKKINLLIIGLVLGLMGNAYAYDDGDFQVWNTDAEEFKINKDAKIALEQEFRWGNRAKELYYQHYDLGFFYDLAKYLNVGAGYRHVLSKSTKNKFLIENEPYVTATLFWDLAGFKFDDRSRLEYNHFDYKGDTGTYRNKLTIKAPWKFTKLQIQPYLSDEVFFVFDDNQNFNKNRFSAGLGMTITKNIKAEIYYMLQSSKSTGWVDANVLGTKFKLVF
jgi:hypothetical protein